MVGIRPAQMMIVATIATRLMKGFSIAAGGQYPAGTRLQGFDGLQHPKRAPAGQTRQKVSIISGAWQKS